MNFFRIAAFIAIMLSCQYGIAQELPSIEPWKYQEQVNFAFNEFCGLSMFSGPVVGMLNSYPLLKSSFRDDYHPNLFVRRWVYFSQATIFAGLTECTAHAQLRYDSVWAHVLATSIGGIAGYLLAESAFRGNRAAAVTSVAVPIAPVVPFLMWIF